MEGSPQALSAIIGRIYDCAAGQDDWQSMLGDLAFLMRADKALLFSLLLRPEHERISIGHQCPPEAVADYASYYHTRDVLLQTAAQQSRFVAGRAIADEALMPKRSFRRSEYYQDFWRRLGILHACAGILFDQDASSSVPPSLLVFYRGPDRPAFARKDEHLVETFIPHIQRGIRMTMQINGARTLSAVSERMFEASPNALAVCSGDGRLLYTNSRMEGLLKAQDGVTQREGRIAVAVPGDHAALLRAIGASAEPPALAVPLNDTLRIHRPSGKAVYAVRVHRLPGYANPLGLGGQAMALLQITDPAEVPPDLAEALRRQYRLTAAEIRLADALMQGSVPKQAAQRFNVSENTIRSQLKSIFEKTGVHRQAELVLLLNGMSKG